MTSHPSILASETPWTEEPDGLQSMGLQRAGHDLVTVTTAHVFPVITMFCKVHVGGTY